MAVQIQLRRDSAADWASANPVLALGEPGVETDTLKVKVGDGSTAWNSLAYSITTQFADLNGKPTTLAGYGITDGGGDVTAISTTTFTNKSGNISQWTNDSNYLTSIPAQSFSSLTGKPTTIAGYGITDAFDGTYGSLSGTPTLGTAAATASTAYATAAQGTTADSAIQPNTSPTLTNATLTGYLAGPASFTIDPAAVGDNTGTVVIAGNLQVDGTQTTINSTTVAIDDLKLSVATDAADSAAANGAGITVGGASANITYTHATTSWDFDKTVNVTGNIGVTGTVDGVDIATRDAVLTSTTTTAGAALPKAGGTMTGDLLIQKAEPIINLRRSDNDLLPGLLWQGSAGAQAASIRMDGDSGITNSLVMSTYNGSSVAERLRILTGAADGIQVTGNVGIGYDSPADNIHILGSNASPNVGITLQSDDTANATATLTLMARDASNVNQTVNIQNTLGRLNIDANMDVIGVGTNFKSASYNILNLQTDTDDNGSSDDGIFKITNGSAGTTKAEFRWDESEDLVHVSYGDHGRHISINSSGNVGVGTSSSSPAGKLHIMSGDAGTVTPSSQADDLVVEASTEVGITLMSPDDQSARIRFTSPSTESGDLGGADIFYRQNINKMSMGTTVSGGLLAFKAGAGVETMVLDNGNVGIGNSDPSSKLEVGNGSSTYVKIRNASTGDVSSGYNIISGSTTTTSLYGNASEGWTTLLSGGALNFRVNNAVSGFNPLGIATDGTVNFTEIMKLDGNNAYFISTAGNGYRFNNSNDAFNNMIIAENGNVTIRGALSKGSGSFRIPHPVASKTATHDLVHSFLEAPQADNLYRGKVDLVAGSATVNIDTVAGMTEGTFAALNREVQCFTSNETGWTAVKGSVSGNTLTITAQDNSCTDTISWMVVGERKDQHMYDTDWTDENGKVIVEPTKRPDKI